MRRFGTTGRPARGSTFAAHVGPYKLFVAVLLACSPPPATPLSSPPEPAPAPAPSLPVLADMSPSLDPKPQPPPATRDPRVDETNSVYPGINAPYRTRGAARTWSRRFERDGREVHDHQAQILAALELRPGMAVADVGAGTGLFTLAFAAAVGPSGTVYAVDLIPEFLAHIRVKLQKASIGHVQLVQASDRSSELPPASVDLVFMSDAYHHLEYPQHVLATLRAALRPGASLWVIDFQRDASSDPGMRRHVRAGKALVLQELTQAGFELVRELPLLKENYVLELRARP